MRNVLKWPLLKIVYIGITASSPVCFINGCIDLSTLLWLYKIHNLQNLNFVKPWPSGTLLGKLSLVGMSIGACGEWVAASGVETPFQYFYLCQFIVPRRNLSDDGTLVNIFSANNSC